MCMTIGPITIDYGMFVSFVLGISVGFTMLFLIYLYAVIRRMDKGLRIRVTDEEDIDEEEIKWLIKDAQEQFKDKKRMEELGYPKHLLSILGELSYDISKKFYPRSKYPYLELTLDETLALNHYITDRIDTMFQSRLLKLTRGTTLRRIVELGDVKETIDNTKIMKTAKKYKVAEIASVTVKTLNAVNPVYWIRKGVKDVGTSVILSKLGLSIIAITGEETYRIYSKKVFNEDRTVDTDVDGIYGDVSEVPDDKEGQ
jgi:hypothetical protein